VPKSPILVFPLFWLFSTRMSSHDKTNYLPCKHPHYCIDNKQSRDWITHLFVLEDLGGSICDWSSNFGLSRASKTNKSVEKYVNFWVKEWHTCPLPLRDLNLVENDQKNLVLAFWVLKCGYTVGALFNEIQRNWENEVCWL
jgi:hypothetical protein